MDFPFILLHSVDSTNNYAMGLVHAGMAQQGMAVFAREQTQGRGQRNRSWISASNSNIILSVILEINSSLPSSRLFLLSKSVAVATADFFNKYAVNGVSIKWPNDIYWNDRKAGGILIENVFHGSEWNYSIVGVGLNINQVEFQGLESRAVSLKQITGKDHDTVELARELHQAIMEKFFELKLSAASITKEYTELLYKREQAVRLKKDNQLFEGVIKDVTDFGELVVAHPLEERFGVGEVEWVVEAIGN